jgi:hypothetical protein
VQDESTKKVIRIEHSWISIIKDTDDDAKRYRLIVSVAPNGSGREKACYISIAAGDSGGHAIVYQAE